MLPYNLQHWEVAVGKDMMSGSHCRMSQVTTAQVAAAATPSPAVGVPSNSCTSVPDIAT